MLAKYDGTRGLASPKRSRRRKREIEDRGVGKMEFGGWEEEDDGSEEEAWGAKEEWARVWAPVEVEEGKGDSKRHSHSGRRWIVRVVEVGC